ncbi:MAG TPA: protein kinase [Flavisolibacter sp.]|nr:protein kinase [Flavisolibacter sp.]
MAKVFTITEGLENMGALKTGGQGSVYKGRRKGDVISAVKLLPTPIHSEDPNDKNYRDFLNEVNKLKKVNEQPNPNIVKILNFGITDSGSFPFIEMEFIEGPDLEELLKPPHDPIFTIKEVIKVAEQLSNALAHCHNLDIKHGDVKSNNVKFNEQTGNYLLLDFGLAAMSDEQRRTSLRRAGAVEFMAPEQNEGILLFQSDIYGFGIILFELLAGVVPFPLHDKGETARNSVMLAHMERHPPDLKVLRNQNLPESWSEQKKHLEMQVPEWLMSMIYRCLRKKPEERFANGKELHEYVVLNSSMNSSNEKLMNLEHLHFLQQKVEELRLEKEKLQKTVSKYQNDLAAKDEEINALRAAQVSSGTRRKGVGGIAMAVIIAVLSLGGLVYVLANKNSEEPVKKVAAVPEKNRTPIGQYRVLAAKAFFHTNPDESTRREAYIFAGDPITALEEQNDFIYTEFRNSRNQLTKGWLRKKDLVTVEEWNLLNIAKQTKPLEEIQKDQLRQAEEFVRSFQYREALNIYRDLAAKEVPAAMYEYGNMALLDQNQEIDCDSALVLVEKAGAKNHTPAKSTLGFLYLFAENKAVLSMNNYNRCTFKKDLPRAIQLLTDAALKGDDAAKQLLDEYNRSNPQQ